MSHARLTIDEEVARYLRTGESDSLSMTWPGGMVERAKRAREDLRGALVREVRRLAEGRTHHPVPEGDTVALTRHKVEPMVRGLFTRGEQDPVLRMLEKSVVFLTTDNLESTLLGEYYDYTAWNLANLYLGSVGAELLDKNAPRILGLSQGTTCYVSAEYFGDDDPFADFVVHEAAHVFHNCKRGTIGLPETRTREFLLDIAFAKRESFAFACEAYARILEYANTPRHRRELAAEYARTVRISDECADTAEIVNIVQAAATARNGWKVIRVSCAPPGRALRGRVITEPEFGNEPFPGTSDISDRRE